MKVHPGDGRLACGRGEPRRGGGLGPCGLSGCIRARRRPPRARHHGHRSGECTLFIASSVGECSRRAIAIWAIYRKVIGDSVIPGAIVAAGVGEDFNCVELSLTPLGVL